VKKFEREKLTKTEQTSS